MNSLTQKTWANWNRQYEYIAQGAIIRSRINWYEHGEQSNKYFLNLANYKKKKMQYQKISGRKRWMYDWSETDNDGDPEFLWKSLRCRVWTVVSSLIYSQSVAGLGKVIPCHLYYSSSLLKCSLVEFMKTMKLKVYYLWRKKSN